MIHARKDYNRIQDIAKIVCDHALAGSGTWLAGPGYLTQKRTDGSEVVYHISADPYDEVAYPVEFRLCTLLATVLNLAATLPAGAMPIPNAEPVFLLRGQDLAGAEAVDAWANAAEAAGASAHIVKIAKEHAAKMVEWADIRGKVPDLPKRRGEDIELPDDVAAVAEKKIEQAEQDISARQRAHALPEGISLFIQEEPIIPPRK